MYSYRQDPSKDVLEAPKVNQLILVCTLFLFLGKGFFYDTTFSQIIGEV